MAGICPQDPLLPMITININVSAIIDVVMITTYITEINIIVLGLNKVRVVTLKRKSPEQWKPVQKALAAQVTLSHSCSIVLDEASSHISHSVGRASPRNIVNIIFICYNLPGLAKITISLKKNFFYLNRIFLFKFDHDLY